MKPFVRNTLASALGFVIAIIVISLLTLISVLGMVASSSTQSEPKIQNKSILKLNLSGQIVERGSEDSFGDLLSLLSDDSEGNIGLDELLKAICRAKDNKNIAGIYMECSSLSGGFASYAELRRALLEFKESGKFVYSYADMSMSQGTYYLSSMADSIFLNPFGDLALMGMSSNILFYTDVFKKIGVTPEIFKVGTYKSAVEPYINTEMSEASREQTTSFLTEIWNRFSSEIADGRGMTAEQLNLLVDTGIMFQKAEWLKERGLIDSLMYRYQVTDFLAEKTGCDKDNLHFVSIDDINGLPDNTKKYKSDKIAILYASGEISPSSSATQSDGIIYKPMVEEIDKLREDDHVKAVVFRVNSPGGDAYTSEQICQAIKELKKEKPVVVSMGDYAASGGYYISCHADRIIASPSTLTGSIGIFGMFFNAEELAQKVGLHLDGVKTNKYADFGILLRSMREDEKALLQHYIENGYDNFVDRCASGRGIADEEIRRIAEGRVWTGQQGLGIGLVDTLGYLDDAVKMAAELAGIESYRTVDYPAQKDFFSQIMENLNSSTKMKRIERTKGIHPSIQKELNFLENHSGMQARMPYTIDLN